MLGISANTTSREGNSIWGTMQVPGVGLCWYLFVKNKTVLYIVEYNSKFPIVERLTALQLMTWLKQPRLYLQNQDSPRKLFQMQEWISQQRCSDNFADRWIFLLPQEHWSGGSVYKIYEMHNQKCLATNNDVSLALLQIRSVPTGAGLPSPAMLLFKRPIRELLSEMNRETININNDDTQYEAFKAHQDINVKDNDTHEESLSFL